MNCFAGVNRSDSAIDTMFEGTASARKPFSSFEQITKRPGLQPSTSLLPTPHYRSRQSSHSPQDVRGYISSLLNCLQFQLEGNGGKCSRPHVIRTLNCLQPACPRAALVLQQAGFNWRAIGNLHRADNLHLKVESIDLTSFGLFALRTIRL